MGNDKTKICGVYIVGPRFFMVTILYYSQVIVEDMTRNGEPLNIFCFALNNSELSLKKGFLNI